MEWQTPKTDWYGKRNSDGTYIGDRFNATDFNRIKNNLKYLHELALTMYEKFVILYVSEDKNPADFLYADEINRLEQNLTIINNNTVKGSYGTSPTYAENGNTIDFKELNRLESATLDIYKKLMNQAKGRRVFTWNFGMKGDSL